MTLIVITAKFRLWLYLSPCSVFPWDEKRPKGLIEHA